MEESAPAPEAFDANPPTASELDTQNPDEDLASATESLKEALNGLSQLSDMIAQLEIKLAELKSDPGDDTLFETLDVTTPADTLPTKE